MEAAVAVPLDIGRGGVLLSGGGGGRENDGRGLKLLISSVRCVEV